MALLVKLSKLINYISKLGSGGGGASSLKLTEAGDYKLMEDGSSKLLE